MWNKKDEEKELKIFHITVVLLAVSEVDRKFITKNNSFFFT